MMGNAGFFSLALPHRIAEGALIASSTPGRVPATAAGAACSSRLAAGDENMQKHLAVHGYKWGYNYKSISPLLWVISTVILLIALLTTTHEPPSRITGFRGWPLRTLGL